MVYSNRRKELKKKLKKWRYDNNINKCVKCGKSLENSKHRKVCNKCYEDKIYCTMCGKSMIKNSKYGDMNISDGSNIQICDSCIEIINNKKGSAHSC